MTQYIFIICSMYPEQLAKQVKQYSREEAYILLIIMDDNHYLLSPQPRYFLLYFSILHLHLQCLRRLPYHPMQIHSIPMSDSPMLLVKLVTSSILDIIFLFLVEQWRFHSSPYSQRPSFFFFLNHSTSNQGM